MEIKSSVKTFFSRFKDNLMKTTNGMAIGLFGTLIIGTIINVFGRIPHVEALSAWAGYITGLMGAGIGLGVALSLKRQGVSVVGAMAAGVIGNYAFSFSNGSVSSIGDPLSCYVSVILYLLAIKLIMRKKTPVDLILIPLVGLIVSIGYSWLLSNYVHMITVGISNIIEASFSINGVLSFLMCMIVSALVGMALTAPISSVAICVAISMGETKMASIAALIGCCTQMLGFAIHTAHDNKWGSVLAVGIGTSMLQFKNIVRKPTVWLPTVIVSAILGPLAMTFDAGWICESYVVRELSVSAGMGTSGLVGPINLWSSCDFSYQPILWTLLICIVLPLVAVFLVDLVFRKLGWIKPGDFSLQSDL